MISVSNYHSEEIGYERKKFETNQGKPAVVKSKFTHVCTFTQRIELTWKSWLWNTKIFTRTLNGGCSEFCPLMF